MRRTATGTRPATELLTTIAAFGAALFGAAETARADLDSCVARLRAEAIRSGVSRSVANAALGKVSFDERAVRFSRTQPESITPIWDYMAFLVDKERLVDGAAMMRRHGQTLARVERAYGVDRHVILALWGIESDFGRKVGDFFVPHAMANVICARRNPKFFRRELIHLLKIVSRGDVKLGDLQGSWAGAFGQTQFMPSTYTRLAVDFDRDGRRDLVNSVPDALASAANFLRRSGWRKGLAWGWEVRAPRGFRGRYATRKLNRVRFRPLDDWGKRGFTDFKGRPVRGRVPAALVMPAGPRGPAFLVTRNFRAIYSYNVAVSYALAISHLSDRLRGGKRFRVGWPTNDPGLSRRQRLELQKLLLRAGYDIGKADGRIGPITVAAIKSAQKRHGMKPDGRPSMRLYKALGGGS